MWQLKDAKSVARNIRELVDLQAEVLQNSAGRSDVLSFIQSRPDLLLNRIIKHLLYIFDVPQVDGLVARLNSVYLQMQEADTFLRAMKLALGRDESAANTTVFADLSHIVSEYKTRMHAAMPAPSAAVV